MTLRPMARRAHVRAERAGRPERHTDPRGRARPRPRAGQALHGAAVRRGAQDKASPNFMGLISLGLGITIFLRFPV